MQKKLSRPKPRKIRVKKTPSTPTSKAQPSFEAEKHQNQTVSRQEEETNQVEQNWQAQYEALNSKYQFLMAEYANYKKNNMRQLADLRKYEGQHLIQQLLTHIMDNFDRALEQKLNEQNINEFRKGISMIYENLKNLLQETGVKEVNCKGELFNPSVHCALDSVQSTEVPPEHILHVIKKAYFFHDKLLRPAEVIVAKTNEPALQNKETSEQKEISEQ